MCNKVKKEYTDYTKVILGLVAISGILALGAIAPNVIQLLKFLPKNSSRKKHYINQTVQRLVTKGFLKLETNSQGIKVARLTEKGERKLKAYELKEISITKPKKWDGKYRVIIFDIKEWKRGTRDSLRQWFEELGLIKLQNSVWVYPYDCREIITLLKANHKIGKEVLYMEVNSIENDQWLKKAFNL